ncbi:MAG TPA: hypothetical protein VN207_12090, partial [Ktedonobacteraceae bacterium]|nr:hypothetical protein [Ktedonobacteraceae bacterium]
RSDSLFIFSCHFARSKILLFGQIVYRVRSAPVLIILLAIIRQLLVNGIQALSPQRDRSIHLRNGWVREETYV